MKKIFLALCIMFVCGVAAFGAEGSADKAWERIEVLRKGPGEPPANAPEEVVKIARGHLLAQEKALQEFLISFPNDSRRYEAEIELASVSATLGASLTDRNRVEKAIARLAALERDKEVPSKLRADAAFQRVTTSMQTVNLAAAARPAETGNARGMIVDAAESFAYRYPDDRRAARLLAEAATILDEQPGRKRKVLEKATVLARDEGTKQRVADDLRRLDMLGKVGDFAFEGLDGREFSLAQQRGKIVVLVFWASWSPPSVAWIAEFAEYAKKLPAGRVVIATVSLDKERKNCVETLKVLGVEDWPTAFSGKVWESPMVQKLAINALPTVFIFDGSGTLRALNARETYQSLLRQLLSSRK